MDFIDIEGIDRAVLIAELYNNTQTVAPILRKIAPKTVTPEEIRDQFGDHLAKPVLVLDYVSGKPLKVTLDGGKLFRADLYDRDSAQGKCREVVEKLRAKR